MKKLATLYAALAQALSDVMAYPKHGRLGGLKQDAEAVCQAAKLKALPAAQPTANERAAVGLLALALADVLEHPRTPVELYNTLVDLSSEMANKLHEPGKGPHYEAGHLRWQVAVYVPEAAPSQADLAVENARLRLLLEQANERAADSEPVVSDEYAPEVEARRADYEKLAESLAHIVTLETRRVRYGPDIRMIGADNPCTLGDARDKHLQDLFNFLDWTDARTYRKFYAELRLYLDQSALELQQKNSGTHAATV